MAIKSDDFSNPAFDEVWSFDGPTGTSASLGTAGDEAYLTLVTPEGDFNVWRDGRGASLMQASDNVDLSLEARFLTTPSVAFQMQGFLVAEDADSWIRFDTYYSGTQLRAFAAVTIDGTSAGKIDVAVTGSAEYLKVDRVGDTWTLSYSADGETWQAAGSFDQAFTVTSVGLFAGSTEGAGGYTAEVDYFETASDPLATEDGVATDNAAPTPVDDTVATDHDTPVTFTDAELLANDSDPDGDPLTVSSVGTPASGTLVDNGDGSYTFTPAAGTEGPVTIDYAVSDGTASTTATLTIDVAEAPAEEPPAEPASLVSDDFSGASLDPVWSYTGQEGGAVGLGSEGGEAFLTLTSPEGAYDVWRSGRGVSIAQETVDEDFTVDVRYLTRPAEAYEMQGIKVEENDDTWIRFDTYTNGSTLYAFAAVTIDGSSQAKFTRAISGDANYLRLVREGDVFTFYYSGDGVTYTRAGSVTQDLTVTKVGPFAGSTAGSGGYTAQLDYFEVATDPLASEDGNARTNAAPVAADDAYATDIDTPVIITAASLLGNDTDADGDTLTIDAIGTPSSGSLVDNGDGTYTFTPDPGFTGTATFGYTVTDGAANDTGTATVEVTDPGGGGGDPEPDPISFQSDDFSAGAIDAIWTFDGPSGTAPGLDSGAGEAFLTISTPNGNFNAWNGQRPPSLLQSTPDDDFSVETRFLSTPTLLNQMQGILVQEDADNWMRFDVFWNGSTMRAFSAVTVDDRSSVRFNVAVSGEANFLRVERVGDNFTFSYSADGVSWTTAGSYIHDIAVTAIGPFAGTTADAFTAMVDYFEFSSDPLLTEDGDTPDNAPPVAAGDAFATQEGVPVVITAASLLANDNDADGDSLSIVSVSTPSAGTLVDNGDGTYTFTPADGFTGTATFDYEVTDGIATDTATVSVAVTGDEPAPTGMQSDDFSGETLSAIWHSGGELGTSVGLDTEGAEAFATLTVPDGNYNVWNGGRGANLLQAAADEDFGVTARFLSTPAGASHMQGIFVEEDASNFMRFDVFWSGSSMRIFSAVTVDGRSSARFNKPVSGEANYLRVERDGDVFTFLYSADGETWTTAGSYSHSITVTAIGPFAGTTGTAFTAEIDFFETDSDPILNEDAPNAAPVAVDDELGTPVNTALVIAASDLLANDTDAEGDPLELVSIGDPSSGTITANGDGTYTFTPAAGFVGTAVLTYLVTDNQSPNGPTEGTLRINVSDPDNTAPVAVADAVTIDEDGTAVIDVLANDSDGDGDPLTIALIGDAGNGTVVLDDGGTPGDPTDDVIVYTPDADFFGEDTFTYTIDDGRGLTSTASVTVTVDPQNDAPVGAADHFAAVFNTPLVIVVADLLGNDTDADGDPLSLGSFTQPANGTLVDNGDGTLTYTPDPGYHGTDGFTYVASDGTANSAPVAVAIDTGYPGSFVSDDFVASTLDERWYQEGGSGATLAQGTDASDSYLEIIVPAGSYDLYRNDKSAPRVLQAASDEDFAFEARFLTEPTEPIGVQGLYVEADADTWVRFDVYYNSNSLRMFIGLTDGGATTIALNTPIDAGEATHLKIDREGDVFTFLYSSDGETWQVAATRTFDMEVTAAGVWAGNVNSGAGYTAKVDYVFNSDVPIESEDDAPASPVAVDDVYAVDTGVSPSLTIALADLLANDSDPNSDPIAVTGVGTPDAGSLVDNGDGTVTYTAAGGFTGVDRVTYTVGDGTGTPDGTGTILIGVDNSAPTAVADVFDLNEDGSLVVDLVANDGDPDGDAITVTAVGTPQNGTLVDNGDGTWTYVPFADFFGTDSVTYTITDGILTSTATATFNVAPMPDAPVAVADALQTQPETVLVFNTADLLGNDYDPDGEEIFFGGFQDPQYGTLVYDGEGVLTYTPAGGFTGLDSFVYTVLDESGQSTTGSVEVAVGTTQIDVWYGDVQSFGTPAETQSWINILGNVDLSEVASLAYSLNGGADRALDLGPDTRRLHQPGDFNVDIAYAELDGSSADDIVTIKATLNDGVVVTRDVIVEYEAGDRYDKNYSIDWGTVSDLQDVAQVVDGHWGVSEAGLRLEPGATGYDRFVTIGDQHWDNYQLVTTVDTHDLHSEDPRGRDGGVFGFGALWTGHTDDPVSGWQPKSGWNPSEIIMYESNDHGGLWYFFGQSGVINYTMQEDTEYNVIFRVEQEGPLEHTYKFKIWEVGDAEPTNWLADRSYTYDEPMTGSLMLLSHYYDVTFGDLTVTEITGNDILVADTGGDILRGVDAGTGVGEIDTFRAGAGVDVAILGEDGIDFYDDGNAQTAGLDDYAFLWGFDLAVDKIQLGGSAGDYVITAATGSLPAGQAIYRDEPGGTDELIAVVDTDQTLSLSGNYFIYDDTIA